MSHTMDAYCAECNWTGTHAHDPCSFCDDDYVTHRVDDDSDNDEWCCGSHCGNHNPRVHCTECIRDCEDGENDTSWCADHEEHYEGTCSQCDDADAEDDEDDDADEDDEDEDEPVTTAPAKPRQRVEVVATVAEAMEGITNPLDLLVDDE